MYVWNHEGTQQDFLRHASRRHEMQKFFVSLIIMNTTTDSGFFVLNLPLVVKSFLQTISHPRRYLSRSNDSFSRCASVIFASKSNS